MKRSLATLMLALSILLAPQAFAHSAHELHAVNNGADADAPGNHGMFMVGSQTLFLVHMPMFTTEKHRYQIVLQASLPADVMAKYQALRAANPNKPYNLINVDNDTFTLPQLKAGEVTAFKATIFDGYSNDGGGTPGPVLFDNVPVTVEAVVIYRPFNLGIERPKQLVYTLFGRGNEAHLTHYIAQDPDFQEIITLPGPPAPFSAAQLVSTVDLNFTTVQSLPIVCQSPLKPGVYPTLLEGRADAPVALDLGPAAQRVWYSTGNLLNKTDPCQP
ncbi:hypothetical protein [Pseudomonas gessardii]|uniref:hypothetical protein n=1 Tax=Pseudomonas gessardii TaxID=78544 RepID=UPI0014749ACA|nr:hypothetical protein [Pseudomonas gessardii]NNA66024.1 hypothetical protein [Pseudomonas gessardii]